MMNRKIKGLLKWLLLLCLTSTADLAAAGSVPPIPTGPLDANGNPATPDYYTTPNWANSPPLAKFVDTLPGLGSARANNLGQYLPVAKPDVARYPGSDYYEIELVEYRERMHSDLPAQGTLLRGYRQVNYGTNLSPGTLPSQNLCGSDRHPCTWEDNGLDVRIAPDPVHYLGPVIFAERDRPVRITFTNKLPVGEGGKLFLPVDTTVMGAGKGPAYPGAVRGEGAPCDNTVEPNSCASYTENRAVIHLHGGRTPWVSDGTPHQWITPNDEITPFDKGVSLVNVPDMSDYFTYASDPDLPDPWYDGTTSFYYSNQQSARLMFYHDQALGITRLNVYAGEAAGYLVTDKYEQDLIQRGIIPPDQIPLVIQDKTFVDATPTPHPVSGVTTPKVRITDPLWNWGSGALLNGVKTPVTGDLWLPHVYMPAQTLANGFDGVNPFGRWMYGPWYYPAREVEKGALPNPYYDPDCSSANPITLAQCVSPGQAPEIPGIPHVSVGNDTFHDTAAVNGTVFPTLTVDPRAYRFRILNAASDRFWNLSFFQADPARVSPDPRLLSAGRSNRTEVKMVPASPELAREQGWPESWPVDGREEGVPDPALRGPSFLQIGNDGGFLPKPVEIRPQPVAYFTGDFWAGTVDKTGLALGPAERADVIVDFSQYAGKTLILYNDAPAPWPYRQPVYDYFTGAPDQRDSGGYGIGGVFNPATGAWEGGSGPRPGYGPNSRTLMQVIVRPVAGSDPPFSFNRSSLEREFTGDAPVTAINPAPAKTLFERAQDPIIVGQQAYQGAYPGSYFAGNHPWEGVSHLDDDYLNFLTVDGREVVAPHQPKGLHDVIFDPVYGRMSGSLGMQRHDPTILDALFVPYGYADLQTEQLVESEGLYVKLMLGRNIADGTQIWKITNNGLNTHPIHFHFFDVQVINRVGWDGRVLMPDANELGWKETLRISPLMDTVVALRPRALSLPFAVPNSRRPLNPTIPLGSSKGFNNIYWQTGSPYPEAVTNVVYDFGSEYVWQCNILSQQATEMRPIFLNVRGEPPPAFSARALVAGEAHIMWDDPTPVEYNNPSTFGNPANEVGFNIYGSDDGVTFTKLNRRRIPANTTSVHEFYRKVVKVEAYNAYGSTFSNPASFLLAAITTADGQYNYQAPASIALRATVNYGSDLPPGVTISQVVFYSGDQTIGVAAVSGSIADFTWNNPPIGSHLVSARITDNRGAVAYCGPVMITITGTLHADFRVTGSAAGTDLGFCETLTFASTSTGSVSSYNWLINGASYGTSTVIRSLPIGSYPVTLAIGSATGETARVTKTVNVVSHIPVANAGGPYTIRPGENLTLNGTGTDPADPCSAAPLSYAWNVDNKGEYDILTARPTLSYNTLRSVLGVGTSTMTFRVTDANGGAGTATATVTVADVLAPASITVPAVSTTGNYTLSWAASLTPVVTYTLEESTTASFAPGTTTVAASGLTATSAAISGKTTGTFYYRVKAVKALVGASAWTAGANGCMLALPPTAVSLTPAPASPQLPGAHVTFTAAASGGSGAYLYEFYFRTSNSLWSKVQASSSDDNWVWETSGLAPGVYYVQVKARTAGSTSVVSKSLAFTISAPAATSVTLAASLASPQPAGAPVTFTGAAAGGSGTYQYEFYFKTSSSLWSKVQAYSSDDNWVWQTSGLTPGVYYVQVNARAVGSTAVVSKSLAFTISAPAATSVTLTASLASPQPAGAPVTFTGAAAGGSGTYQYEFYFRTSSSLWNKVQAYSSFDNWVWQTSGLTPGVYYVQVNAKAVGSTAVVSKSLAFTISAPAATSVTLTPSTASPQAQGAPVTFTGAAAGGTGPYEYEFYYRPANALWSRVQPYSSDSDWVWNTSAVPPGTYYLLVNVRAVGSTAVVSKSLSFSLY